MKCYRIEVFRDGFWQQVPEAVDLNGEMALRFVNAYLAALSAPCRVVEVLA